MKRRRTPEGRPRANARGEAHRRITRSAAVRVTPLTRRRRANAGRVNSPARRRTSRGGTGDSEAFGVGGTSCKLVRFVPKGSVARGTFGAPNRTVPIAEAEVTPSERPVTIHAAVSQLLMVDQSNDRPHSHASPARLTRGHAIVKWQRKYCGFRAEGHTNLKKAFSRECHG